MCVHVQVCVCVDMFMWVKWRYVCVHEYTYMCVGVLCVGVCGHVYVGEVEICACT